MNAAEAMKKYTTGEISIEEANEALIAAGTPYRIDPTANKLTEQDIAETTIGTYPSQANGWGLLDTGTGTLNKVKVENGRMVNCDCGRMYATCTIAGRTYQVHGTVLTDKE